MMQNEWESPLSKEDGVNGWVKQTKAHHQGDHCLSQQRVVSS